MRTVLQEGKVEQRVQYIVEGLFKVQRDGFEKSGHSQVPEGLDLLDDADKFEVEIDLETTPDIQQSLNIFRYDPDYEQHEREWEVSPRPACGSPLACSKHPARQTRTQKDVSVEQPQDRTQSMRACTRGLAVHCAMECRARHVQYAAWLIMSSVGCAVNTHINSFH